MVGPYIFWISAKKGSPLRIKYSIKEKISSRVTYRHFLWPIMKFVDPGLTSQLLSQIFYPNPSPVELIDPAINYNFKTPLMSLRGGELQINSVDWIFKFAHFHIRTEMR